MLKKEAEKNHIINQISKKLKIQEKKSTEESRVAVELRRHYDAMKKKNESLAKQKTD